MKTRDICLAAIKQPGGARASEIAGHCRQTISSQLKRLVVMGIAFQGGDKTETRYFDTKEKAQAFIPPAQTQLRRQIRLRAAEQAKPHKRSSVGWGPNDPMHITPQTKHTKAPAPVRSLHTNTHGTLG